MLDGDDSLITPLTESTNVDGYIDDDPTQQSATLELPTDECIGCSVSDHTSLFLYLGFYLSSCTELYNTWRSYS